MSSIKNIEDWWTLLNDSWDDIIEIISHCLPGIDLERLNELRLSRNPELHSYLNSAWIMASESYAWSVPGWGYFCDLCSENWVFNE